MEWLAFRGDYYLQLLTLEYTVVEVERKKQEYFYILFVK